MTPCEKSTVLFPYFAEWFVDGFLRSERPHRDPDTRRAGARPRAQRVQPRDRPDPGLRARTPRVTRELRAGEGGRLLSQQLGGEEYPPYLYDGATKRFDHVTVVRAEQITDDQRRQLFAFGSDTGNLQVGFVMMGVLFLREHNRVAGLLAREYGWDDERLFQTTRNILTVILIKIVVEEYINHISPFLASCSPIRRRCATRAGTGRTGWRSSSTCSTAGTAWCRRRSGSATATSR